MLHGGIKKPTGGFLYDCEPQQWFLFFSPSFFLKGIWFWPRLEILLLSI